jgi:hypothetical protein
MSEEQIETVLGGVDSPEMSERLAEWRRSAAANRFVVNADALDAADHGPASGYIRVLAAAVQRLSDEGVALVAENARLQRTNEQLATQLAALGVDVWVDGIAVGASPVSALEATEEARLDAAAGGSRLAALGDPAAWGRAEAFDAFRAEAAERAGELRRGETPPADGRGLGSLESSGFLLIRDSIAGFDAFRADVARWAETDRFAEEMSAAREEIERKSAAADVTAHRAEVERAEVQAAVDRHVASSPLMAEIRRQMDDAARRHVDALLKAMLHGGQLVITFAPLRDGDAENDELPEARVMVDGVEITVETLEMDGFPGPGVRLPPFEDGVEDIPDAAESEIVIWWDEDAQVWCARAQGISSVMAFGVSDSDCKAASGLFEVLRHYVKMRQMYIDNGYSARALDRAADLVAREDELMSTLFLRPAAAEYDFSVSLGVRGDDADTAADYRPEVGQ